MKKKLILILCFLTMSLQLTGCASTTKPCAATVMALQPPQELMMKAVDPTFLLAPDLQSGTPYATMLSMPKIIPHVGRN